MDVSTQKRKALEEEMLKLGIQEDDILEKFILGSGSGGQKVNKTSSCVYLKHIPTNTEVKCQKSRSQEMNRFYARRLLCDRIGAQVAGIKTKREREIEKIRQQKKRRTRRAKEKMLDDKKMQAKKKENRKPVVE